MFVSLESEVADGSVLSERIVLSAINSGSIPKIIGTWNNYSSD
jgi:hypothetical protein